MKWLTLILVFLYAPLLYSQKSDDIPDFGKIDKADLMIAGCDFDKNAEALVLFDVEEVQCHVYPASVDARLKKHIRLKILNDKGLDQANIRIPYFGYAGGDDIGNINAHTDNLDSTENIVVSRLEKKSVVNTNKHHVLAYKIYDF